MKHKKRKLNTNLIQKSYKKSKKLKYFKFQTKIPSKKV